MPPRPTLAAALAAHALAIGCGDQGRAACEARVTRLEGRLAATPVRESFLEVPDGLVPPTSATAPIVDAPAPVIQVTRDRAVRLDGRVMPDAAQLHDDLETLRRNWGILHPRVPYAAVVHVWADRALTLAELRAALAGADDRRARILALDPAPPAAPEGCPATMAATCAQLPALDPAERAAVLSREWTRAVGRCPQLISAFGAIARADAITRGRLMRDAVPEAMRACGCGYSMDEDAVEYLTLVTVGAPFDPIARGIDLPPVGDADATTTLEALFARR